MLAPNFKFMLLLFLEYLLSLGPDTLTVQIFFHAGECFEGGGGNEHLASHASSDTQTWIPDVWSEKNS